MNSAIEKAESVDGERVGEGGPYGREREDEESSEGCCSGNVGSQGCWGGKRGDHDVAELSDGWGGQFKRGSDRGCEASSFNVGESRNESAVDWIEVIRWGEEIDSVEMLPREIERLSEGKSEAVVGSGKRESSS